MNKMELGDRKVFKEGDFVALFLPLLCKAGVFRIEEMDLQQKLVSYKRDPEYQELFQDITLSKGVTGLFVNLREGFYQMKYFRRGVLFDSFSSNVLCLLYDEGMDLSFYMNKLSFDGQQKIRQMALEISKRYLMESRSAYDLKIYGVDPNTHGYELVCGLYHFNNLRFDLLTDGDILDLTYPNTLGEEHFFYNSPMFRDECVQLENNRPCFVRLRNATYAVQQGYVNDELRYASVETKILDEAKLQKIVDVSNTVFPFSDVETSLTNGAPYVRQITLK